MSAIISGPMATTIPAKAGIKQARQRARGIADPFALVLFSAAIALGMAYVAVKPSSSDVPAGPPPAAAPGSGIAYAPYVFLDQATGCEYLSTQTSAGLVPRIAADGKTHMGCKGATR